MARGHEGSGIKKTCQPGGALMEVISKDRGMGRARRRSAPSAIMTEAESSSIEIHPAWICRTR